MKQRNLFITLAMVIVATAVAFVSCKKETGNTLAPKAANTQRTVDISKIENMNVYLHDFRQKMTESKSGEAMNTEDAAWHLACLANYDFCRVNVEYNDFKFDTIEMQVNVTDGMVLMGDLNSAYEQLCAELKQYKKGFSHDNENLYYTNMSIGADGNTRIALMTSFLSSSKYLYDHTWYFEDYFEAGYAFDDYFSEDSTFVWNTTAARELERVLNLFEHHENGSIGSHDASLVCYTPTRNHTFDYNNTYDPYHSGFYNDSRVFAKRNQESTLNYNLSTEEIIYCLDSYLGLGYDFIANSTYTNERPVCWKVYTETTHPNLTWWHHYHQLYVEYGDLVSIIPGPWND